MSDKTASDTAKDYRRVIVPKKPKTTIPEDAPAPKRRSTPRTTNNVPAQSPAAVIQWNARNIQPTSSVDVATVFGDRDKNSRLEDWQQGVAVGDQDLPFVGLAYPSFCWEMFTSQTVLPVSSCYALAGPTNSFKSHLVMDISNWAARSGGVVHFIENESKYNPDMARAVMGHELASRVWVVQASDFTQVQEELVSGISKTDKARNNRANSVRSMLQIVDSIVGNATSARQTKVKTEGHIERDYPDNALAAANFLPSYMPMLNHKPYIGIWVTHYGEAKEGNGPYARTVPKLKGGGSWEYRCRMAFIVKRISEKPEYIAKAWHVNLVLFLKKDAGVRNYRLPVTVKSGGSITHDEITGETLFNRETKFCWDESSMLLLLNPDRFGYPLAWKKVAKSLLGLKEGKIGQRKIVYAEALGVTPDNSQCTPTDIMDALYSNSEILDMLRAEFQITKGLPLTPDTTYDTLLARAKEIAVQRITRLKEGTNITYISQSPLLDNTSTQENDD